MKAEMKAVVASLVVIALALTAVSGVTYSWFSVEEKAQIEVTTGNIALNMDGSLSVAVYEYGKVEPISTITPEPVSGTYTFNVVNLKDNDTIKVSVPKITIDNTIDVKYYEKLIIKEGDSETTEFFTVTGLNSDARAISADASDKSVATHEISILFDSDNRGMDKNYSISISFIAIQANAIIDISGDALSETIESAPSGTVITLTSSATVDESITVDKDITLDLSHVSPVTTYAADSEAGIVISSTADTLFIVDGGSLTVIGGTINCKAMFKGINGASITIKETKINSTSWSKISSAEDSFIESYDLIDSLTMIDVAMDTKGDVCFGAFKNAQVTIIGGKYSSDFGCAFLTNGKDGNDGQNWTVDGATFNVTIDGYTESDKDTTIAVGIQCHNNDSWTIKNCKFNITDGIAISVRGGQVDISDCTFATNDGPMKTGQVQCTDPKITVEAGHFIAVNYSDGSYGCDGDTDLTLNGESISVGHDRVSKYYPADYTAGDTSA